MRATGTEAIAAWNALMAATPAAEPAAGTVRVRIGYWYELPQQQEDVALARYMPKFARPDLWITADLPLRTQPLEIPGTVEASDDV